ncbi:hypothetical protein ACHAW6_002405, partial [Cyclotella cf. meneghiniana]
MATICQLPIQCHEESAMVNHRQQFNPTSVQDNKTMTSSVGGSNGLNTARFCCPDQRQIHNSKIKVSNNLCRPFLGSTTSSKSNIAMQKMAISPTTLSSTTSTSGNNDSIVV